MAIANVLKSSGYSSEDNQPVDEEMEEEERVKYLIDEDQHELEASRNAPAHIASCNAPVHIVHYITKG